MELTCLMLHCTAVYSDMPCIIFSVPIFNTTQMVSVEDTRLRGAGSNLKRKVWNAAKGVISEWTGQELTECSMYGE